MSEETTRPEGTPVPQPQVQGLSPADVTGIVNLEFRLNSLKDKYTREFRKALDEGKINEDEYNRQVTNFVLVVQGIYNQAAGAGVRVGDGEQLTHEAVFDRAYQQYVGRKYGEPVEPPKDAPVPPGTSKVPSGGVREGADTIVGGEELPHMDFPMHDNETWLAVRREALRRFKTPKGGPGAEVVNDVLSSIATRVK